MTLTPSTEGARAFLARLDPEADAFTLQTFDDMPPKRLGAARVHQTPLANDKLDELVGWNQKGAGVFVTVNRTDGKGRQEHNIAAVRALFVDLDGAPLAPILIAPLEPHIVVESSPGRYHAYWLCDDCPREQFRAAQQALAAKFDGDPSVCDLPRVMRLPGFVHNKGEPFLTHTLEGVGFDGPPYAFAEIVGTLALDLTRASARPESALVPDGKIGPGNRHTHLFALGRSMANKGATPETVLAALAAENAARCDPPLSGSDTDELARRAFTAKHSAAWDAAGGATARAARAMLSEHHPGPYDAAAADMPSTNLTVDRLAALSPLEYDRVRAGEAKALGVRVNALDAEVRCRRARLGDEDGQGAKLDLHGREAWPEPVDGIVLLDELRAIFRRFIVLPDGADTVLALWTVLTYAIDVLDIAPILAATAPEKGCGKTTVLDLLARLVHRPLATSNVSTAALFRSIEKWTPTLLMDEFDSFLRANEELRGVINSGHTRQTAFVIRCVGDDAEPRQFSTWGAKAIAGIGELPATIADRSLVVRLRRALPDEAVSIVKLRHAQDDEFEQLARKLVRWTTDNSNAIRSARPDVPDALSNRAADNAEPLLAIADTIGGNCSQIARAAILEMLCSETEETASLGQQLLRDVATIFAQRDVDRLPTREILNALHALEEAPWVTLEHGRPMTARMMADRMRRYGIRPETKRDGAEVFKGYERGPIEEAAKRYAIKSGSETRLQGLHRLHARENAVIVPANVTDSLLNGDRRNVPFVTDVTAVTDVTGFPEPVLDGAGGCHTSEEFF